jgi:hypothetical protein
MVMNSKWCINLMMTAAWLYAETGNIEEFLACVAHDCAINTYIHQSERQRYLSLEEDLE